MGKRQGDILFQQPGCSRCALILAAMPRINQNRFQRMLPQRSIPNHGIHRQQEILFIQIDQLAMDGGQQVY